MIVLYVKPYNLSNCYRSPKVRWFCLMHIPYSLDYSPGLIRVLTRIQSRKLEHLFNKKWQKLEYNPAQKMKKINSVPDCNPDLTVYLLMHHDSQHCGMDVSQKGIFYAKSLTLKSRSTEKHEVIGPKTICIWSV